MGCFQPFLRLGSLAVSCISHSVTAAAGTQSLQGSSSLLDCFPQPYLLSSVLTAQRRHRNVGRWGLHLAHAIVSFRSALRLWFLSRGRKAATTSSCSVTRSCPTLFDPMDRSTPGCPVPHCLPECAQARVLCIGDAIQPTAHRGYAKSHVNTLPLAGLVVFKNIHTEVRQPGVRSQPLHSPAL